MLFSRDRRGARYSHHFTGHSGWNVLNKTTIWIVAIITIIINSNKFYFQHHIFGRWYAQMRPIRRWDPLESDDFCFQPKGTRNLRDHGKKTGKFALNCTNRFPEHLAKAGNNESSWAKPIETTLAISYSSQFKQLQLSQSKWICRLARLLLPFIFLPFSGLLIDRPAGRGLLLLTARLLGYVFATMTTTDDNDDISVPRGAPLESVTCHKIKL